MAAKEMETRGRREVADEKCISQAHLHWAVATGIWYICMYMQTHGVVYMGWLGMELDGPKTRSPSFCFWRWPSIISLSACLSLWQ